MASSETQTSYSDHSDQATALDIYDIIKSIKDPERPETLEDLEVVREESVTVRHITSGEETELQIGITFTPTVPHCSLATLIGLCLRVKLERCLQTKFKLSHNQLDIQVLEGTHSIEDDVNKQINDKERVSAAMENAALVKLVEECIGDD